MPDSPDDLARGIAENIGVMPIVRGAGNAGSSLIDFLSGLMPQGGGAQPKAQAAQAPAQPGFFGGLLDALMSGFQSTADAAGQDVEDIKQKKMPRQAAKTAGQAMMMTGRGGFGPGMPKVNATATRVFTPEKGWEVIEQTPSVDVLKSVLMRNPNQFTDVLLKLLQLNRSNAPGVDRLP